MGDEDIKEKTSIFLNCPDTFPRKIYLRSHAIGDDGCYWLSKFLSHKDVKLEGILLPCNSFITGRGFQAIATSVAGKGAFLTFFDCSCRGGNKEGDFILAFSKIFAFNPDMLLNEINFSRNLVTQEALQSLCTLLVQRCSPLDVLCLSCSPEALVKGIMSLILTFNEILTKHQKVFIWIYVTWIKIKELKL